MVKRCIDVFLRNDIAAYAETCRMLGRADLRSALPRLKMPTAVVVGEEDYATPVAMAEALHRRHRRLDLHGAREGAAISRRSSCRT